MTPLKKRRLARESLSVDGSSLRSISEEDDSPSARIASPSDALPPSDTSSSIDNPTPSTNDYHCQVTLLVTTTAAAPASEVEAVVRSPTNMAAVKIVAVDFIDLY